MPFRRLIYFSLLPLLCFAYTLTVYAQEDASLIEMGNGIAAIAEGELITIEQLRRELEPIVPRLRTQARTSQEFSELIQQVSGEILQNMIDRILIVKSAEKEGLLIPPSYIDQEYDDVLQRDFGGDRGRLLSYLKAQGITSREFRRDIYRRVVINYMRQQNRKSQSEISPELIQNFYIQNKIRFYQSEAIHLRQIILPPQANEGLIKLNRGIAQSVIQELEEGANFEDVANKYSQDVTGRKGGDWGWAERQDLRKELSEAAFALKPGQYSQPIELNGTVFILYCENKREEMIQPVSEVRDVIEDMLAGEIAREAQERWLEDIRKKSYVRYFLQMGQELDG